MSIEAARRPSCSTQSMGRTTPRGARSLGPILHALLDREREAPGGRHRGGRPRRQGGGRTRARPEEEGAGHGPHIDGTDRLGRSRRPPNLGGAAVKFGITANPHIPSAMECTKRLLSRLEAKHEVLLESDLARAFDRKGMPLAHMKPDVMLAIGGDGPILRALQLSDAKVLGINSGSLGFLAEVNADEAEGALDRPCSPPRLRSVSGCSDPRNA